MWHPAPIRFVSFVLSWLRRRTQTGCVLRDNRAGGHEPAGLRQWQGRMRAGAGLDGRSERTEERGVKRAD